jgi:hypothetical protein
MSTIFEWNNNVEIRREDILPGITKLVFGLRFNKRIQPGVIPDTVEFIITGSRINHKRFLSPFCILDILSATVHL